MSLIRKPAQLTVQPTIKVLIYGQPGLGKTTLALSTPQPLLLDFDGGIHRVSPQHQTDTLQVSNWDEVLSVLKEDLTSYKTLVIDTAGKMLDFMTAYLIKNDPKLAKRDGALQLQGYGARKVMFSNFLAQVNMLGKHLVFVAHDKEEKDGDTKFIRPEIGGSSGGDLIKEIDLVGYMEAIGKKRTISFDPQEKYYGKNTCHLPSLIELPNLADSKNANNLLSDIFQTYAQSLEERKKVATEYNSLIEVVKNGIEEAVTCEDLNSIIPWAKSLTHIWDSSLQASILVKEKAKKLNLTFDKKINLYVEDKQLAGNMEASA